MAAGRRRARCRLRLIPGCGMCWLWRSLNYLRVDDGVGGCGGNGGRAGRASAGGGAEAALEIPDQVIAGFDTDGEADGAGGDAGGGQLVVFELAVGGAGGMDDEALGVADVGEMAPERERFDEALAGRTAARDVEGEDRARAARQILLREGMVRAGGEAGVAHALHLGMAFEEGGDGKRVLDVAG